MAKRTKKCAKKHEGLRMSNGAKDKYADLITAALSEMERADWQKPWVSPHTGRPANLYRKNNPYKGCNAFWLQMLMEVKGWTVPYFLTKTQLKNEDGNLKYTLQANSSLKLDESGCAVINDKGMPEMEYERRFPVILFKPIHKDADGNNIEDDVWEQMSFDERQECKTFWYQTSYQVYNVHQTNLPTAYPDDWAAMTEVPEHDYAVSEKNEVLERMIMEGEWICPIRFEGQRSCYHVGKEYISLPMRSQFLGDVQFYGTAIHEMAHSTGKELGRNIANEFGTEDYAIEEMIAELSAAIICSMLGITKLLDKNHIAYVNNWRMNLSTDKNVIPIVIDDMQRAVNYFMKRYEEVAQAHKAATPLLIAA